MTPQPRRVRVLNHRIDPAHGPADACLVCCIDPRWWNASGGNPIAAIPEFVKTKGWKFVPLTEAGGIKVLASQDPVDGARKGVLLQRIEQELGLHHPGILALSVHRDCGAYGYSKAFDNDPVKENERLFADLWSAKQICEPRFGAKARIELYVFDAQEVEEIIF